MMAKQIYTHDKQQTEKFISLSSSPNLYVIQVWSRSHSRKGSLQSTQNKVCRQIANVPILITRYRLINRCMFRKERNYKIIKMNQTSGLPKAWGPFQYWILSLNQCYNLSHDIIRALAKLQGLLSYSIGLSLWTSEAAEMQDFGFDTKNGSIYFNFTLQLPSASSIFQFHKSPNQILKRLLSELKVNPKLLEITARIHNQILLSRFKSTFNLAPFLQKPNRPHELHCYFDFLLILPTLDPASCDLFNSMDYQVM